MPPAALVFRNLEPRSQVNGTLTTLLFSSIAALSAALGPAPIVVRRRYPSAWLGWANALAAGLMLGAAFILMLEGVEYGMPLAGASGAVLGIFFVFGSHSFAGTADLDLNLTEGTSSDYGYKILIVNSLHSASEGVAIGIGMVIELRLGIFLALALAVHNIAEAMALSAVLIPRGIGAGRAAVLAVMTNASQVLLAVATFAILSAAPSLLPWVLGFAVGALIYLTLVELLPEAYKAAHQTGIAIVASIAMSVVVLLRVLLP